MTGKLVALPFDSAQDDVDALPRVGAGLASAHILNAPADTRPAATR